MKKTLLLLGLLFLTANFVNAEPIQNSNFDKRPQRPPKISAEQKAQKEQAFEQRLGLTDAQKQQAKEIRNKGHEQIKPVFDKLQAREREVQMVKNSKLSAEVQQEKLRLLDNDIQSLKKQAKEIRKENMKEFEGILTTEQQKTLKEMKQEGREKYHKQHPGRRVGTMPVKPVTESK